MPVSRLPLFSCCGGRSLRSSPRPRVPRIQGTVVAGSAAFKNHLSYLPFSGSVLEQLGDELRGYTMTKSSLHFPVDRPVPKTLVEKLIAQRLDQISQDAR